MNKKKVRFDRIPTFAGNSFSIEAIEKRINWIENVSGKRLKKINNHFLSPYDLPGNIENFIGAVQIPVGIAGPIKINGDFAKGYFPVPIATTEGALISSITRGAVVCSLSGGVETFVSSQKMVRSPAFFCENMKGAINLEKWIKQNSEKIIRKAESISSVAKIVEIETIVLSNVLHVKFYYETGDAAGQNMTTACTAFACDWIEKQNKDNDSTKLIRYIIEGNFSGDKKLNYQNFIKGRGITVQAHCLIPEKYIKRFLRTTTKDIVKMWNTAEISSLQIGMFGSNINFSNVIAGIFTATGQDIASVHESSGGIIKFQDKNNNLDISVFIPSLVVGTVGGGTGLPTQREALEIMGCFGSNKVKKFAEIIAATVLALDLSTSSAIAANEFVKAHERLGRNKPKKKDVVIFDKDFFNKLFKNGTVLSFKSNLLHNKHGITSGLVDETKKTQETISKYILSVRFEDKEIVETNAVLKIKSQESDIVDTGIKIAKLSGEDRLPGLFENYRSIFGFDNCNERELEIFSNPGELKKFMPEIFGTCKNQHSDFFAILMEDLSNHKLIDSVNKFEQWQESDIKNVLKDLASFHSIFFNKLSLIPKSWLIEENSIVKLKNASSFLAEFTNYNALRFPNIISDDLKNNYNDFIKDIEYNLEKMDKYHKTLCHNDFNLRNICLKETKERDSLVMYDFELARFQNPQSDLIEFLIFVLPNNNFIENFYKYTLYYIETLEKETKQTFDKHEFFEILKINLFFAGITRYNLYLLAHNLKKFSFMERVYHNLSQLVFYFIDNKLL